MSDSSYVNKLHFIYINRLNGNIYADTDKRANEFDETASQCVYKKPTLSFLKVLSEWWEDLCGTSMLDDELLNNIQNIVNSKSADE